MISRVVTIVICLTLAVGSMGLARYSTDIYRFIDDNAMELERAERLMRWRLNLPQRGIPALDRLEARLAEAGVTQGSSLFMRIFKKESELELWMLRGERFVRLAAYPICKWSGELGPKLREGDRQSPEGLYSVARHHLNPNSRWHRSFNLGYPNRFDRSLGRTGSFIMVHGGCSSIGCFAMTNPVVDEIWQLVLAALRGGQKRFQVHVFPFRMTERNLALHAGHRWHAFWQDLKPAYDLFEQTRIPPLVRVCNKRYQVAPGAPGDDGSARIVEGCEGAAAARS